MEQKRLARLANELTDFCLQYGIFNISCSAKEIKRSIEEQFVDVVFVENLIVLIIKKTNNRKDVDADRLIELLSELERVRLELEYKAPERAGRKC